MKNKEENLKKYLNELGKVAVAYSSGVDSTYLLKTAHDVLRDNAIAITASANWFPKRELKEATNFCRNENIRQIIFVIDASEIEGFSKNPINRCYICKKNLFTKIKEIAAKNNIENVIEGSNMDDLADYRPGLKALEELQIKSPLRQVELFKDEIRELSKEKDLPTWDKPSFACLASRFVYGEIISDEKLSMIERAEELLRIKNFKQFRVRIHDKNARIEILPDEFEKIIQPSIREEIISEFKNFGFEFISLDLQGYRTGSMNINLNETTAEFT